MLLNAALEFLTRTKGLLLASSSKSMHRCNTCIYWEIKRAENVAYPSRRNTVGRWTGNRTNKFNESFVYMDNILSVHSNSGVTNDIVGETVNLNSMIGELKFRCGYLNLVTLVNKLKHTSNQEYLKSVTVIEGTISVSGAASFVAAIVL